MQHEGKVALVTGGGGGIGRAVAVGLAGEGAAVAVLDYDEANAGVTAEAVRSAGRRAMVARVDVRSKVEVQAAVRRTLDELGRVDFLVNCAGIAGPPGGFRLAQDLEEEIWDATIDTHLKGMFLCVQAVIPPMIAQGGGRIVNISSRAAFKGRPGIGAYSAAKAGMIGLSRSLALELGPHGITVNNVAPGTVVTPMVQAAWASPEAQLEEARSSGVIIAPVRMARPDEIAAAVLYLCSEQAAHVTGTTMHVNGGTYMP